MCKLTDSFQIEFDAVRTTANLKVSAARMRLARLRQVIENGMPFQRAKEKVIEDWIGGKRKKVTSAGHNRRENTNGGEKEDRNG